jgi:hypothetical protein
MNTRYNAAKAHHAQSTPLHQAVAIATSNTPTWWRNAALDYIYDVAAQARYATMDVDAFEAARRGLQVYVDDATKRFATINDIDVLDNTRFAIKALETAMQRFDEMDMGIAI